MDWKAFQTIMVALLLVLLIKFGIEYGARSSLKSKKGKKKDKKVSRGSGIVALPIGQGQNPAFAKGKSAAMFFPTGSGVGSSGQLTGASSAKFASDETMVAVTPSGKKIMFGNDDILTDSKGNRFVFANDDYSDDQNDDSDDQNDDSDDQNDDSDESVSFDSAQTMLETLAGSR